MVLTEDGTSDSLALDARSLLYSATSAGRVHWEPNILGISRGYRCVLSDSCSNTGSCRIDESDTFSQTQWKASSRKALGGIFLVGTKVSLFVLHHCSKPVCISASKYWPGRMPSATQVIQLINESVTR